jgi:hypothetical protein
MTNLQLCLAVGAPVLFNAVLAGILIAYINAKMESVNSKIEGLHSKMEGMQAALSVRMDGLEGLIDGVNRRLDDLRDLWRAELRRVEEVLDARLKHLEES